MSKPEDDGFLSRWSARKRGAASPPDERGEERSEMLDETSDASTEQDKSDDEILAELDLPDPDTLGKGDDFTRFMTSAVPARLRNRALRRLWLSDPVLANLDEMIDYGEDFTDAATVVENMKTVYDSVRGMLPEDIEEDDDPQAAENDAEKVPDEVDEATDPEQIAAFEEEEPSIPVDTSERVEARRHVVETAPAEPTPRAPRMQFRFDDA